MSESTSATKRNNTVKGRWNSRIKKRDDFLDRGRECAKLTLPFLLPDEGDDQSHRFYTPYQGFGARAVNNLASKLLLALFPTVGPFFRYMADEADLQEAEGESPNIRTDIDQSLKKREKVTLAELEGVPFRAPFFLALKLMIVSGNALVHLKEDGKIRVFRLDSYVVCRDSSGNILEIITREKVSPLTLSEEVRREAGVELKADDDKNEDLELYTCIKRTANNWEVWQEINQTKIKSTEGTYPLEGLPWLPLRFSRIDGEDYGRGLVEEYFGDFVSLDGFRQNLTEGAAALSKVIFLIRKNGQTRLKDVSQAENGDVKYGSADDVTVVQADKRADFAVIRETSRDIEVELAKAFLLNSSVQRDAERVTAEEVRFIARELEDTLGGVYTVQTQEFQLPFINLMTARLEKSGKLSKLPKGSVQPRIITGLSALGRTDELDRMLQFVQIINQVPGAAQKLDLDTFITRTATNLFIDQDGLIKTEEQLQQEAQAAQQQQLTEQALPGVVQEVTKGAMNNVNQENQ